MTSGLASIYTCDARRPLTQMLDLPADALPGGGNFYPEEDVLVLLAQRAADCRNIVICGGGPAAAVTARAMGGNGQVTVLETCGRMVQVTERFLADIGCAARVIETGLDEYDKHNLWYPRHVLSRVPNNIDLLFVDGPGHFAGRTPRWPAGPELFTRLSPSGIVVLDDGGRVKEKKALQRWAEEFPWLTQTKPKKSGGAIVLTPN